MKSLGYILFIIILIWSSCMPYEEDTLTKIQLDYSDKTLQGLINAQDERNMDSLIHYLSSENPTYRYVASHAMSSAKNKDGLTALYELLDDPIDDVRSAAIHAIGQIGDSTSVEKLLGAFDQLDSLRLFNHSNSQILEAVGKCGQKEHLKLMASIKTYNEKDTLLLLGQARGIYRFARRSIIHPSGTKLMLDFIRKKDYPQSARLMAAHYLHRAKGIKIDSTILDLCTSIKEEKNTNIRMALVTGLAKSKQGFARDSLISLFKNETDYRVKCNIIRAMGFYEYADVAPFMYEAVKDKNKHVAITAADYFYLKGTPEDGKMYRNTARQIENDWRLKHRLYAAANKNMSVYFTQAKSNITLELLPIFNASENSYEKAAILAALSEFEWNYPQLKKLGLDSKDPILKTAGTEGLTRILESKNFRKTFGETSGSVSRRIKRHLVEALDSKDAGAITVAATAIQNPDLKFKEFFSVKGFNFLDTILMEIPLPQEIETYKEVEKAIDYLNGKKAKDSKPAFNHPIEWEMVENLNNRVRGIIQTNKGKIVLEFFHHSSPASVANFIRLAKNGYFDGKKIHRVVPNFVIQGGCSRGDGYGSEPFTIRSEFSELYYDDEGYLGMASAGNDTESTQWFITHSPTPHLDGNYTIFGKVKEGMEIVHQIEMGDIVEKVAIKF